MRPGERRLIILYIAILAVLGTALVWGIANWGCPDQP